MDNEKDIEHYFKREVEKRGAIVWKFVSPNQAGVPDRLVLLPGGRVAFAEIKSPGKIPRPLQRAVFNRMTKLGFRVWVIDSREQVGAFIKEVVSCEVHTSRISSGSD